MLYLWVAVVSIGSAFLIAGFVACVIHNITLYPHVSVSVCGCCPVDLSVEFHPACCITLLSLSMLGMGVAYGSQIVMCVLLFTTKSTQCIPELTIMRF